ncbi:iron chelate uptake ABC transporter family permease subunit [Streptomyces sp. NBC_01264]|nr:iron chelate uptake ABC transporter family permease subunit [Streptomyces sp. NBC_01264]MCX4780489.1 iron chelate uptake ABC transporter family permease subunit [Streptomyces sp. NBC_01264]
MSKPVSKPMSKPVPEPRPEPVRTRTTIRPQRLPLLAATAATAALVVASLFVGGYDISLRTLLDDPDALDMFLISRVPRTLALILSAAAMGVCGVFMQMLVQNRIVEPTTTGASEWAALGILLLALFAPAAPVLVRMGAASAFAFAGTMAFLGVLRRVRLRSSVVVPLAGIMLGSVVSALTLYLASGADLLQMLTTWRSGGFSGTVRGQYEPLWVVGLIVAALYLAADRFTIAGLGKDVATNLGLRHERIMLIGVSMVALATGVTTIVVGFVPFLGLVVPNLVSLLRGDDVRANLPWVVIGSVALMILCDLIGRVVVFPLEIPASVILGAVGATLFIGMILRQRRTLHG